MSSTTIKGTIKDFFVYFGLALVLYTSLAIVISLCFTYIEMLINDRPNYYLIDNLNSLRWSISTLVILFPLLLGLSYLVNKDILRDPMKLEIRSRKWLLYSVTFLTSATVTVDLVYLVYSFLGGDLAKEFILKSLTILMISGVVFAYYYQELKRGADSTEPDEREKMAAVPAGIKVLGGLTTTSVIALLGFGFYTVGSPMTQRKHKQDEQRIQNISDIKRDIEVYYKDKGALPENLEVIASNDYSVRLPKDPETNEAYEYKILTPNSFELCANFRTERDDTEPTLDVFSWDYRPGRNCFPGIVNVEQAAKP